MRPLEDQRMLFGDPPLGTSSAVRWRVARVKPNQTFKVTCLVRQVIWAPVHYYRGRSVPCLQNGCTICKDMANRWYAYVPSGKVEDGDVLTRGVLELPAGAAMNLEEQVVEAQASSDDGWLGVEFTARRAKKTMRSPVVTEFLGVKEVEEMVDRLEIMAALCRMWGVPIAGDCSDEETWRELVTQRLDADEHYVKRNTARF